MQLRLVGTGILDTRQRTVYLAFVYILLAEIDIVIHRHLLVDETQLLARQIHVHLL